MNSVAIDRPFIDGVTTAEGGDLVIVIATVKDETVFLAHAWPGCTCECECECECGCDNACECRHCVDDCVCECSCGGDGCGCDSDEVRPGRLLGEVEIDAQAGGRRGS